MNDFPIGFVAGALAVEAWAYYDFHQPVGVNALRAATTMRRYTLGLVVYMIGTFLVYYLLTQSYGVLYKGLFPGPEQGVLEQEHKRDLVEIMNNLSPGSIAVPIFLIILCNGLPILNVIPKFARKSAQELAHYPHSIDLMLKLISAVPCNVDNQVRESVASELETFGVGRQITGGKTYLASALSIAWEIATIRGGIFRAAGGDPELRPLRMYLSTLPSVCREPELNCSRFFRHLSEAFLLEGVLRKGGAEYSAYGKLSDIIRDEGDSVLRQYRRILCEAALSRVATSAGRNRFLHHFGYQVPAYVGLPFWPIALSFCVVFVGILMQQGSIYYLRPGLVNQAFDLHSRQGLVNLLFIMINQSLTQSLGVLWAVGPKFKWLFARPSLKTMPIPSYLIFGVMGYLTSVALFNLMYIANPPLPFAIVPLRAGAILSILPFVYSVIIAVLTDLHALNWSRRGWRGRLIDGATVACCVAVGQLFVLRLIGSFVLPYVNAVPVPTFLSTWSVEAFIRVIELVVPFACVGFAIGATVPLTAAKALESSQRIGSDGMPKLPPMTNVGSKPPPRAVVNLPRAGQESVGS